jgi:hypothetical protein
MKAKVPSLTRLLPSKARYPSGKAPKLDWLVGEPMHRKLLRGCIIGRSEAVDAQHAAACAAPGIYVV